MSDRASPSQTLELYVRSLSSGTGTPVESMIDQLERAQTDGEISDYSVTVWGERISTEPTVARTAAGKRIRERVREFRQWATESGETLSGGFDRETIHSAITGDSHEFITLPSVALACRNEGELSWVVPSKPAETADPVTAADRLRSLLTDRTESDSRERAVVPSDD